MAAWTFLSHGPQVINAAEFWRENCLLSNNSVFTDKTLWTKENICQLKSQYFTTIIRDKRGFFEKLLEQVNSKNPEIPQLAAEVYWFFCLIVYEEDMLPSTKKKNILKVWELSEAPRPESNLLEYDPLRGLINLGMTNLSKWRDLGFLLAVLCEWKSLSLEDQYRLIDDNPWGLCEWVTNINAQGEIGSGKNRSFRNIFLYFCYPEFFESINGKSDKDEIYNAFSHLLRNDDDPYSEHQSLCNLDKSIYKIRKALETKEGTNQRNFYYEPWKSRWLNPNIKTSEEESRDDNKSDKDNFPTHYTTEMAVEDLFLKRKEFERILTIWRRKKNLILQGPPGVGKSFIAKRLAYALIGVKVPKQVGFVQFHESYSYEEFVQGYRPSDQNFVLRNGKFYKFCSKARKNPEGKYVFIIDEINRGNLSKILGELMLLIEPDKRNSEWKIPLTYDESTKFYVPENVYLLGLMNTADRSLSMVDYALRRRFGFYELKPQFESTKFKTHLQNNNISGELIKKICSHLGELNQQIENDQNNLGRGYSVGHSFFCGKMDASQTEKEWYELIIKYEIVPLLEEYWFDSFEKGKKWTKKLLAED